MSTEGFTQEISGGAPEAVPDDFEGVATGGGLFIRDLASGGAPLQRATESDDDDDEEENDEENIVTTMMVGEEGRGEGGSEKEPRVTTMMVGEEGRSAAE
jgi:hypothetical protein